MSESGGTKYDQEKPDFSLIDAEWLEEVAKVMTFGKKKYAAHNWRAGFSISRSLSAGLRHLWAVVRGEDYVPESGLSHLAHLSCCAMFAYWHLKHRRDLDDRYKQALKDDGSDKHPSRTPPWTGVGLGGPLDNIQFTTPQSNSSISTTKESL
jgi:hypothetical protein